MRIVKIQLDDFSQNISLLGISSTLDTYQIAWNLNKLKDFTFSKDLNNKALDAFKSEKPDSISFLLKTKNSEEIPLFPDYKNIDFLMIFNNEEIFETCYQNLKTYENLSVYRFNFERLNKTTKSFLEKLFL